MSRVPSAIDGSCVVDDINDSSGELPPTTLQAQDAWSQNPKSKMVHASPDSVKDTPIKETSNSPSGSSRSRSSTAFPLGTENVSPSQITSRTTLHSSIRQEFHLVDLTAEESTRYPVHKSKQLPYLPHGDCVEDVHLNIDAIQTGHPNTLKLAGLSVTNPDHEDLERHSGTKIQSQVSNDFGEGASAEIQSLSNYSPSRNTSPSIIITSTPPKTLKRIVDSVRQRQFSGPRQLKSSEERQDLGDEFEPQLETGENLGVPPQHEHGQHRKASSGFSSMFVATRKSATTDPSISSGNISSQKTHRSRSRFSRSSKRSSRLSTLANGTSMESDSKSKLVSHKTTIHRALQRRRIIEELISSESGYLDDLRILTYVYLAILGSIPICDRDRLNKVEDNMLSMIALHEDILKGMKFIAQKSTTPMEGKRTLPRVAKHIRYESIDSLKSRTRGHKSLNGLPLGSQAKDPGLAAEPREAADVASLFAKMLGGSTNTRMGKFSVYEEYGANYAEMLQACALASRTIPIWEVVERGIEALVNKVFLKGAAPKEDRKALAFEDLLIKPIQRICKYPLLFAELESYCPAIDDPESLITITKVMDRLRETAHEVNNATNDLEAQARLRRSQHLEDLLAFPNTLRPSFSLIRDLGHATLCGVLFVVYQARGGGIRGDFMLCALFNSYMLLASSGPGYRRFIVGAIIRLDKIRLLKAGSERGLQCHETPYAWKMIFEANCQLYELLFCACTELEAQRWKSKLQEAYTRENRRQNDVDWLLASNTEFLFFEVKEYANKSKVVRTSSRGRVEQPFSQYSPQAQVVPVTVKNTHAHLKGDHTETQNQAAASANRSHLQATTDVGHTLFAERTDRIRMEQAMSEVWTRGTLPFPGMRTSRSGQFIRASASMMRKLSKTSITSTPSKRSASQRSQTSIIGFGLDGIMDDPFVDHPTRNGPHALEPADPITERPVFHDQPGTKDPRKVSFSDDLKRSGRKDAQDDGSDASTVVGKNSARDGNRPNKKKSLSKALSRERIRGWFT